MSNLSSEFLEYEVDDLEALMGEGTEPQIQTGDGFDLHPQSESTVNSLNDLRRLCHIPPEGAAYSFPFLRYFSSTSTIWEFPSLRCRPTCSGVFYVPLLLQRRRVTRSDLTSSWNSSRLASPELLGPQIRPVPSVDFLNFYKVVLERPVNWNSFTLERIHGAGFSVRMSLTNPVDPPPAEIDLSSLNARDRRKIKEANKKSMAVAVNNAPPSTPAADNVVATAEEEGLTGDSSLIKKRKAEELEPLLQGRPKNTRKGRAAPSNLSIPEPAEAQDVNPDSGTVLKEPLGSGMLPPRRPRGNTSRVRSSPSSGLVARASSQSEKIGNMFRCFHTRFGKKLPSFEWWKPDIKKMYISHSFPSSQETTGLDSARQEEIERLERSGEETRKTLIETEQKLKTALADHNFAKGEIELLRSELNRVKTAAEELGRKNESLSELKDRDVRRISHDARKEVKGAGQKFLLAVQEFITADKAWNKLNFERDEMKSNLDLIKEIEDGTVNLAEEKETVGAELAETEAKLATAPQPYLNLQQFASKFADSPPLTEPNIESPLDELRGSLIRSLSSPRLWERTLNRGANPLKMLVRLTLRWFPQLKTLTSGMLLSQVKFSMASPQGEPSDSNPPRFPSGESLFPTEDGFTPQGVAIPCFLSSMSKEEKIECHEFMEQITERYVFLCSERQRLGRKRRVLEERIARTERKIRRLESDVHNWERRGFDSIARIPGCLREHIRFLKKHWDIYQRSLKSDERENGSSSDEVPSANSPPS
ncbi:hypothetical protein ISN44_As06g036190 [Arabidopsis suecica]|uniref:Uncharacterized protein n=1 Tax=Arabidopsis suecica TaxID=45249 RepID=A0A8T2CIZ0_ARASU|nr:hypothetical protein ISN44_As06g036190 [Arabidopsis suecica]